jgi:hypothetical protein
MKVADPMSGRPMRVPSDALFMPPELWGAGAMLPAIPDDGMVYVSDRGPAVPTGRRYTVMGFDPDTTERYWMTRPEGERERRIAAARKISARAA